MAKRLLVLCLALITAITATVLLLLILGAGSSGLAIPALAAIGREDQLSTEAVTATHTVCKAGLPACDFSIIQEAVDAASDGDLIKIATGIYTDVHGRSSPPGYEGPAVITQAVYLTKSVIVRGGYTDDFTEPPDSLATPTIIDAQGLGRGFFISGDITTTIAGFSITRGIAARYAGGKHLTGDASIYSYAGGGTIILSATVVIRGSTLFANGAELGSAVYNSGFLKLFDSKISGNINEGDYGGGTIHIARNAEAIIQHSSFDGNRGYGPAVGNKGILELRDSTIFEDRYGAWNTSAIGNEGIALVINSSMTNHFGSHCVLIGNLGTLTIVESTIYESGGYHCSVISNVEDLTISDTIIRDNGNTGIKNSGHLTITQSEISGNHGQLAGGIRNHGNVTIVNSTISGNSTWSGESGGGGIDNSGTVTIIQSILTRNSGADGGVILNSGLANIHGSIISDNSSWHGGIFNSGNLLLTNCTLSGNRSDGSGGGLYNSGGNVYLNNVTITDNTADQNVSGAGDGGGIYLSGGTLTIKNSLLAGNHDLSENTPEIHPECFNDYGTIISHGHNLVGIADGCNWVAATGDLTGTLTSPLDPLLGPLQDNGGDTETHALLPDSPAIDAANQAPPGSGGYACEASDQRGVLRPIDGDGDGMAICDIGAYEFDEYEPGPLSDILIEGPLTGDVQMTHTFTATVSPISATLPVQYVWQASAQSPVTHTAGLSDSVSFHWDLPGMQTLTVTASNAVSTLAANHTIALTDVPISGLVALNDSPTLLGIPTTLSATISSGTNVSYNWDFGDETMGAGAVVTHTYTVAGSYTATVTASNSANVLTATTRVAIKGVKEQCYLALIPKNFDGGSRVQAGARSLEGEGWLSSRAPALALMLLTWGMGIRWWRQRNQGLSH